MPRRKKTTTTEESQSLESPVETESTPPKRPDSYRPAYPVQVDARPTRIGFDVWARVSGISRTHLAGFRWFVKHEGWVLATAREWKERYDAFQNKRV